MPPVPTAARARAAGRVPNPGEPRVVDAPGDGSADGLSWSWTAAIGRGDEAAFERFHAHWFDRSLALARRISGRDEAFCLDVVQDVMLRVVRGIPALRDERAVTAWMARTTTSVAIDHLRADQRRRRRERGGAQIGEEARGPGPGEQLLDKERSDWLRARIAELDDDERRLLAERFDADRTLEAVGAALGISGNAAHGRLHRLLRRLRDAARTWT